MDILYILIKLSEINHLLQLTKFLIPIKLHSITKP